MLLSPLVEPFPAPKSRRPPRRIGYLVGLLLVVLAVVGGLLWIKATPLGFSRFTLRDGDTVEDLHPGTYVVFEERTGASQPALPPPLTMAVTSKQGDVVSVEQLVPPNTMGNPFAYRTPWNEGRAIARFVVSQEGAYHIRAAPLRRGTTGYGPRYGGTLAIGTEAATTWFGSPWGLLLVFGVPFTAGLVVLGVSARRARRRSKRRPAVAVGSTTLTGHG